MPSRRIHMSARLMMSMTPVYMPAPLMMSMTLIPAKMKSYTQISILMGLSMDHGNYTRVSNLTDNAEIINEGDKITADSNAKVFYYEGYGEDLKLPWDIDIDYSIDGRDMTAGDLAGASGTLSMDIHVRDNHLNDTGYRENYMLQISVPMDMSICENIHSDGGTEALSGGTKLINYTVLPGSDADFTVTAQVEDFEMGSININGMPFSMDMKMDDITSEFRKLADAADELYSGMNDLNRGIRKMNKGQEKIKKSSSTINKGIKKLNSGTSELSKASETIASSLDDIADSLESSENGNISDLVTGLGGMADKVNEMSEGIDTVMARLDELAPSDSDVPEKEINSVISSGLMNDPDVGDDVKAVVGYASKAAAFIGAYNAVSQSIKDVSSGLDIMSGNLDKAAEGLKPLESMSALISGMTALAGDYSTFDDGLQSYFDGVDKIAKNYAKFNKGIRQSASGSKIHNLDLHRIANIGGRITYPTNLRTLSIADGLGHNEQGWRGCIMSLPNAISNNLALLIPSVGLIGALRWFSPPPAMRREPPSRVCWKAKRRMATKSSF